VWIPTNRVDQKLRAVRRNRFDGRLPRPIAAWNYRRLVVARRIPRALVRKASEGPFPQRRFLARVDERHLAADGHWHTLVPGELDHPQHVARALFGPYVARGDDDAEDVDVGRLQ